MSGLSGHKESWFGSFGGRKSTEIFPGKQSARQSFSLGQEHSSSNNNNLTSGTGGISMGLNHKFSLTGTILNNSFNNHNSKSKNNYFMKNDQQNELPSPATKDANDDKQEKIKGPSRQTSTSAGFHKLTANPGQGQGSRGNSRNNSPFQGSMMGNLNNGGSSTFVTPLLRPQHNHRDN